MARITGTVNEYKETMTHEQLVQSIIGLAHTYGYMVAGFRPARVGNSWRTPVLADGAGFPDLLLIHYQREIGIVIECKTKRDTVKPEQSKWLAFFNSAGFKNYIIRPEQWYSGEVERILTGKEVR